MTSTQISPIQQVCQSLDAQLPAFKNYLEGTGIEPNRFLSTAKMAIDTHPDKDKLAGANRDTLYSSIKTLASLGLMPDGKESALVVFGSVVQAMPMVQGLVKLARNSGEVGKISAQVVYSNDEFQYQEGLNEIPEHKVDWFGERGTPVGVWAAIKLKSGESVVSILPLDKIKRIQGSSKQGCQYDTEKGKHFDEFWKKAAIRNALKYAPKSTLMEKVLAKEDETFSFPKEEAIEQPKEDKKTPKKKQTKAAKVVTESAEEGVDIPDAEIIDAEVVDEEDIVI